MDQEYFVRTRTFFHDKLVGEGLERPIAEYVASILANGPEAYRRLLDTDAELTASLHLDVMNVPANKFRFVGDYYLIMTGVFPHHFHGKWLRGGPTMEFYEQRGAQSYAIAARAAQNERTLAALSTRFTHVRKCINHSMATNPLHVSEKVRNLMLTLSLVEDLPRTH